MCNNLIIEIKNFGEVMIRVLMVEDHEMTRIGTAVAIEKDDELELSAQADNGQEGVNLAQKLRPDVVLMDIGLPVMDGIEATRKIKEMQLPCKVLVFTSRDNDEDVFCALKAGADGYIMKGANIQTLTNAIKSVAQGAGWLDPSIARLVLSSINRQKEVTTSNKYGLTPRELEVLSLMVEGLTNPQISERLCVTISTTKAHVHSILQKLYINHRAKATAFAVKEGLV